MPDVLYWPATSIAIPTGAAVALAQGVALPSRDDYLTSIGWRALYEDGALNAWMNPAGNILRGPTPHDDDGANILDQAYAAGFTTDIFGRLNYGTQGKPAGFNSDGDRAGPNVPEVIIDGTTYTRQGVTAADIGLGANQSFFSPTLGNLVNEEMFHAVIEPTIENTYMDGVALFIKTILAPLGAYYGGDLLAQVFPAPVTEAVPSWLAEVPQIPNFAPSIAPELGATFAPVTEATLSGGDAAAPSFNTKFADPISSYDPTLPYDRLHDVVQGVNDWVYPPPPGYEQWWTNGTPDITDPKSPYFDPYSNPDFKGFPTYGDDTPPIFDDVVPDVVPPNPHDVLDAELGQWMTNMRGAADAATAAAAAAAAAATTTAATTAAATATGASLLDTITKAAAAIAGIGAAVAATTSGGGANVGGLPIGTGTGTGTPTTTGTGGTPLVSGPLAGLTPETLTTGFVVVAVLGISLLFLSERKKRK